MTIKIQILSIAWVFFLSGRNPLCVNSIGWKRNFRPMHKGISWDTSNEIQECMNHIWSITLGRISNDMSWIEPQAPEQFLNRGPGGFLKNSPFGSHLCHLFAQIIWPIEPSPESVGRTGDLMSDYSFSQEHGNCKLRGNSGHDWEANWEKPEDGEKNFSTQDVTEREKPFSASPPRPACKQQGKAFL